MGKMVSATEFDARFAQLIEDMVKDGEAVAITRDGVVIAELTPKKPEEHPSLFGSLRSPSYRNDWDHEAPVADLSDWDALNHAGSSSSR